ncbi:MAG: HAD family hydrolase [Planctomycetota bacterium]
MFDLDDTLYKERDYVRSGFHAVARHVDSDRAALFSADLNRGFDSGDPDVLASLIASHRLGFQKDELVCVLRTHRPDIRLSHSVRALLEQLSRNSHPLGLITDGRSVTQRQKIQALGLEQWVQEIVVAEEIGAWKPAAVGFQRVEERFGKRQYVYVGDNLRKDFIAPNKLGWTTVCLLSDGRNVHPQDFGSTPDEALPAYLIEALA